MNLELEDKKVRSKTSGNHLVRYLKSFVNAVNGIKYAIKYEHNFIIILISIIVTTILGFVCNITSYEWCIIVLCFGLVFGSELINSSIEATIDLVTLEIKPLAKIAKDCASAATLIFSVMSLIIGIIIFIG